MIPTHNVGIHKAAEVPSRSRSSRLNSRQKSTQAANNMSLGITFQVVISLVSRTGGSGLTGSCALRSSRVRCSNSSESSL